jgi:hypothetical protein
MKFTMARFATIPVVLLILSSLTACGSPQQPETETETMLVCDGVHGSGIYVSGSPHTMTVTITKVGGKVVKAVKDQGVYTTSKVDVRKSDHKGPVYTQLIVESSRIILRTEVTEDNNTNDTVIKNDGAYEFNVNPFVHAVGRCTVREKTF